MDFRLQRIVTFFKSDTPSTIYESKRTMSWTSWSRKGLCHDNIVRLVYLSSMIPYAIFVQNTMRCRRWMVCTLARNVHLKHHLAAISYFLPLKQVPYDGHAWVNRMIQWYWGLREYYTSAVTLLCCCTTHRSCCSRCVCTPALLYDGAVFRCLIISLTASA